MTLTEIRTLLKAASYKITVKVDRFDVKRAAGEIIVDVMFTDGSVAYLPVEEASA